MNKAVDPLLLLKDYYSNGKPINYLSDEHLLVFGSLKIPVDSKTAWIKRVNNTQYTIGGLWYFLKNKDLSIREYMVEADRSSFEKIHLLDKNKIIDYFSGKVDTVDDIDKTLIPETLISVGKSKHKPESISKVDADRTKSAEMSDKKLDESSKYADSKGIDQADLKTSEKKRDQKELNKLMEQTRKEDIDNTKDRELKMMDYLTKNEKKIVSKNSILQVPGKSFASIYSLCCEMIGQKEKGEKFLSKIKDKGVKQVIDVKISTLKKKQKISLLDEIIHSTEGGAFGDEGKPIIIVPSLAQKGNICMANAYDFLVKGEYKDAEDAEKNLPPEEQLKEKIEFEYSIQGKRVKFEVYDSVCNFTRNHWKRVVALFVQGQEWQFKDWPSKEAIVDIFLKVRGYYLCYSELSIPSNVKKWNVKPLIVNNASRHGDQVVHREFWNDLKDFLLRERYKGK